MGDTVLLIELTPAERKRVAEALANEPVTLKTYETAESFFDQATATMSGCVLLPCDLTGHRARALIREIRHRKLPLAIIVIGRNSDLAVAVELVRAGATDFLEKPFLRRDLRARIQQAGGQPKP